MSSVFNLTPRGGTGAAKTVYALRPRDPQAKSDMTTQFASGAAEGLARTAALPVDAPGLVGSALDYFGGDGTSRAVSGIADALTFPLVSQFANAVNTGAGAVADAVGLNGQNVPKVQPTLSENYRSVRNVAGGDAVVGELRNAGLTTSIAPENSSQRYARAVGEFLGGSAIPVGATLGVARNAARAGTAGSFLAPIAANPLTYTGANAAAATSGAVVGEAAYDLTGSPTARVAGGILGGFVPGAATSGLRRAFTGGASGRDSIRQALDDYAKIGATPTLGQATANAQSPLGGIVDRGLSVLQPGRYSRQLAGQAEGADAFVRQALASAVKDAPSDIGAGLAARKGAEAFVDRFRQVASKAYDRVDQFIRPDAPAVLDHTRATLSQIAARFSATPAIAETIQSPTIKRFMSAIEADAAATGAIPYKSLKAIRTEVFAAKQGASGLLPDINKGDLNRIYDALSQDMAATAAKVGGSRAVKALESANKIYAQGAQRIESVIDPIAKGDTPEAIFRAIQRSDPSRTAQFMAALSPEQRASITARVLEKMGEALPSEAVPGTSGFSFNTFLTNYNKLENKRALDVLFNRSNAKDLGGAGVSSLRKSLDTLSSIASRARFIDRQLYNPSGTANRLLEGASLAGIAGGAVFSPATAGVLLTAKIASNLSARVVNSEPFLRWLASTPAITAQKWPGHLARLEAIGRQNPDLLPEVQKLQQQLTDGKDSLDKLSTLMSVVPGMGGVIAAVNDGRNYASGRRELSAENLALTGMNIIPEAGAVMGKADEAGGLIRMDDPLRSGVAVAAGDPQAFLASLRVNNPTNPALGAAGAVSEPAARAAGVPYGPEDQQPQEQSQRQSNQAQPAPASMQGSDLLGGRAANFLDYALMGAGDEVLAAVGAPVSTVRAVLGIEEQGGDYYKGLDEARGLLTQYRSERPGEAMAVGLPAAAAGVLASGGGALMAKGTGLVSKGALGAAEGAGYGAVSGYLSGEGEQGRVAEAGRQATIGAMVGGPLGAGAASAGGAIKWLRDQRDFFNFVTGSLSGDGVKLARSLGINPRGLEQELNAATKEAVRVANQVMKDPEGARVLIRNAIEGFKKGGAAGNLDANVVTQTIKNVFSDTHAVYDPVWRRVFGEALNPEKPLYKALSKLAAAQGEKSAGAWDKIMPLVLREAEKRLGATGPSSRFWNPSQYKAAPITPKQEALDRAMRGVKPRDQNPSGAFGPPIN